MHRAGDPDPGDDGDDDDDANGQDPKGGPGRREKVKGWAGPDCKTENEEDNIVDIMEKAIAREWLLTTKRPTDPPWVFKNKPGQDIRLWPMAVQDYLEWNEHLWTQVVARIKYAMGRMDGYEVTLFTDAYRKQITGALGYRKMEG